MRASTHGGEGKFQEGAKPEVTDSPIEDTFPSRNSSQSSAPPSMGSLFTEFKGFGFWSQDWLLECWLRSLALNLPSDSEQDVYKPGWLHDLRDDWLLQSAGFFNGFVSPDLDRHLTDDHRRDIMIATAKKTLSKLEARGDHIPEAFFYAMGIAFIPHDSARIEHLRSMQPGSSTSLRGN